MKILGIDPGFALAGYGVIEYKNNKFTPIRCGVITTPAKMGFSKRLKHLYDAMSKIIAEDKPDFVAVEELFFNTNVKTAIAVGHARGVLILAAENLGVPTFEYTPLQIKQAVTGYGRADKCQVQAMIRTLLNLNAVPKPDDAADALAVAVCHAHSFRYNKLTGGF